MAKPGLAPRQAALALLVGVESGRLLSEMLPSAVEGLEPDDRARAQRIATETLRWRDRADRVLGPYLRRRPSVGILSTLRMATVEICQHSSAPHGVVDAAVTLAREDRRTAAAAGLVNAVLRKVAVEGPEKWDTLPIPRLPKWLRSRLIAAYGKAAVEGIERAHAAGAPLDLTAKDDAHDLAARLNGHLTGTGSVRLSEVNQVSVLPGFDEGGWWVQDAAAALPARVLGAREGETVLDLCAAPGGKTLQLAAAGATVTALDVSRARMDRLRENLTRTGLSAELVVADALTWQPPQRVDAVLLDAPCTATGTIRRHPDLPYAKDASGLPALIELQARMIDRADEFLRPGGRLVYCTCSLLPEEGEDQIVAAFERNPGLLPDPAALAVPGIESGWLGETWLRTRPDFWADTGGIDGFFIAALRKPA